MGYVYWKMTDNCEKNLTEKELQYVTLGKVVDESKKCRHCKGTGENHYHDDDGCHVTCEYCNGTGKPLTVSKDEWI